MYSITAWLSAFAVFIVLIILDLLMSRTSKKTDDQEANHKYLIVVAVSVLSAIVFAYVLYCFNPNDGIVFITGYLVELSLSIDNVFIFLLIFDKFSLSHKLQHKILFIGVLSAIVLRFCMIFLGIEVLERFAWLMYIFSVALIYLGGKIFYDKYIEKCRNAKKIGTDALSRNSDQETSEKSKGKKKNSIAEDSAVEEDSWLLKLFQKWLPIDLQTSTDNFFIRKNGAWLLSVNAVALLLIEQADLIFALDSIPAVIGITTDLFLVFTSNIMAIVCLRSMYFLISRYLEKMEYLSYSLATILVFIGLKIIVEHLNIMHISHIFSLSFIALCLLAPVVCVKVKGLVCGRK